MFGLGAPELIIIFFVILLLFGAKKLPDLAAGLGKGIKEFKKATKAIDDDDEDDQKKIDYGQKEDKKQE